MFDDVVHNSEEAPSPSQCPHMKETKIINHLSMMEIFANCSYKEKVPVVGCFTKYCTTLENIAKHRLHVWL